MSATEENATPSSDEDNARNPVVRSFSSALSILIDLNLNLFKPNGFSQEMYAKYGCVGCDVRQIVYGRQVYCDPNYPCGRCEHQGRLCLPGYVDPAMGLSPTEPVQFLLEWLRGSVGDVDR
jgi:hypothetical protein